MSEQLEKLRLRIQSATEPHLALVVGSAVSSGGQTPCASAPLIKKLVIEGVVDRINRSTWIQAEELKKVALELQESSSKLAERVLDLPFEVFMNALDLASPDSARSIVNLACNPEDFEPNHNHNLIVRLVSSLLHHSVISRCTLVTTNYDRGLDLALKREFDQVERRQWGQALPGAYWEDVNGKVAYIKIHGCIMNDDSCVYTSKKLTEFMDTRTQSIINRTLTMFGRPDVCLFLGYSFSDPDLRPALTEWLKGARIVWNDLPGSRKRYQTDDDLSGFAMLRREFLEEVIKPTCSLYESNLFHDDENSQHILLQLFEAFVMPTPSDIPIGHYVPDPEGIRMKAKSIISALTDEQLVQFLSLICDSCNCGNARNAAKSIAIKKKPSPAWIRLFLEQCGHEACSEEYILGCRELRKHNPVDFQVMGCTFAMQAFAYLVWRRQLVRALSYQVLAFPFAIILRNEALHLFGHYWCHNWLKIALAAWERVPYLPTRLLGCPILGLLRKVERLPSTQTDAVGKAKILDLVAQAQLLVGDLDSAERLADQVRTNYAFCGLWHGTIWADRTLGWVHLAQMRVEGDRGQLKEAVRAFVLGLCRATREAEFRDIQEKMTRSLLRVTAWTEPKGLTDLDISTICNELKVAEPGTQGFDEAVSKLAAFYLSFTEGDGRWSSLIQARKRYTRTRHPIWL